MDRLLFLPTFLLFLVRIISNIDLDTELVAEFVYTRALCTDNASNEFPINVEFRRLVH